MEYCDANKEMEIIIDASPVGLGGIHQQGGKDIAYANRALTNTESRSSQTERETLGVVWACEHFDIYVNEDHYFTIITDHKPLETIWQKPKPPPPPRIER